jgi:hypothetical protein
MLVETGLPSPGRGRHEGEQLAVVVVALGADHLEFLSCTQESMQDFSDRVGASLIILRDTATMPEDLMATVVHNQKYSRRNLLPYVAKCWVVHETLKDYERMILLDSTCLVRANCDDLFNLVPTDALGGYNEGEEPGYRSWRVDGELAMERRGIALPCYLNTGMLVISRAHRFVFSPERLRCNMDLLLGPYPSQLYVNVMAALDQVPIHKLPKAYNYVPIFQYSDDSQRRIGE